MRETKDQTTGGNHTHCHEKQKLDKGKVEPFPLPTHSLSFTRLHTSPPSSPVHPLVDLLLPLLEGLDWAETGSQGAHTGL